MGNRITKVVTKKGDRGTTSLDGKKQIAKNHPYIKIVGEIDELGAYLGLAKFYCKNINIYEHPKLISTIIDELGKIQNDMFNISGSLVVNRLIFEPNRINKLETEIDSFNQFLPFSKDFLIADRGACELYINTARVIARKVERSWWGLDLATLKMLQPIGKYLNRLSDWLFVAMRIVNQSQQHQESIWDNPLANQKNAKRN